MSEIVKKAWNKYMLELQLHPLRTKAIITGVLAGCNDIVSQKISGIKKLQLRRLLLLTLYGFAYGGPFDHYFHKLMDIIFKGKKDNKTVAKKVLLDQLTYSPWNNLFFMVYYGLAVEGVFEDCTAQTNSETGDLGAQLKIKFEKNTPLYSCMHGSFWSMIKWINYMYVPLQLRVVLYTVFGSCWTIYLNLKSRSSTKKD